MKPLVSVLTTVYNREKYLADCIESVLASTYDNWELIIVDDQSKDKSVEIAKQYAKLDNRIKVYVNEKNLGDYPNRNKAASYAKGKYLKYLDADDLIYPHGLELMVASMEQYSEAALGVSQYVVEDNDPYPFLLLPKDTAKREFLQRGVLGFGPTNAIIKREIFEQIGGFSGEQFIGDTELWYKIALKFPILKLTTGLVYWRQHDGQQIVLEQKNYKVHKKRYYNQMNALSSIENLLEPNDFLTAKSRLKMNYLKLIFRLGLRLGKLSLIIELLRNTGITSVDFFNAVKSKLFKR